MAVGAARHHVAVREDEIIRRLAFQGYCGLLGCGHNSIASLVPAFALRSRGRLQKFAALDDVRGGVPKRRPAGVIRWRIVRLGGKERFGAGYYIGMHHVADA